MEQGKRAIRQEMNRIKHLIEAKGWEIEREKEFDIGSLRPCDDLEWGVPSVFKAPAKGLIRELAEQLSGKAAENDILRERIDELTDRVDKQERLLKELLAPSALPEFGAFEQWLVSGETVNQFRGKHVAFVPRKGIVASSESLDDLVDDVDAMGKVEGLTIGFVPIASASVSKC